MMYDTPENIKDKLDKLEDFFLSNYGEYNKYSKSRLRIITKNYLNEKSEDPKYEIILDKEIAVIAINEVGRTTRIIDLNKTDSTFEYSQNELIDLFDWNYFKAIGSSFNEAVVIIPGDKVIIINKKNHVFEGTVTRIVVGNETNEKEFVVKLKNRQMEEVRVKGNKILLYK